MKIDRLLSQTSFIEITDTVLDSWKNDRLLEAETSLTRVISNSTRQSHHALANRSLVRSRLNPQSWEPVIDDAENVCFDLLSLAHAHFKLLKVYQDSTVCRWLHRKECRTYQKWTKGRRFSRFRLLVQALQSKSCGRSPLDQGVYLSPMAPGRPSATCLTQAVILFMSGKHADAVLRIDDLIAIAHWQPIYGAVQVRK